MEFVENYSVSQHSWKEYNLLMVAWMIDELNLKVDNWQLNRLMVLMMGFVL